MVIGVNGNEFFKGVKFLMLRFVKLGVGMMIFLLEENVVLVLFVLILIFFFNEDFIFELKFWFKFVG